MAIAFRAAAGNGATSSTSPITVTKPTGTVDGDIMVAFASCGSSGGSLAGLVKPASWPAASGTGGGIDGATGNMACWMKVASSEPASWDWTKGGGTFSMAVIVASFSTPNAVALDAGPTFFWNNVIDTNIVAPNTIFARANGILVCAFCTNAGTSTFSPATPGPMTEIFEQAAGSHTLAVNTIGSLGNPGDTGARTAVASVSQKSVSCSLVVAGDAFPTGAFRSVIDVTNTAGQQAATR